MKALIQNGEVRQVVPTPEGGGQPFEVNEDYEWIDCDESVQVGWSYINGVFSAPPAPPAPTNEEMRRLLMPADSLRLEALWEKVVRGNSQPSDDLEVQIQDIYTQYPI